jgi:hypothetical protein
MEKKIAYNDFNATIPTEEIKKINLAALDGLFKKPYD